jgi:ribokinase
LNQFLDPVTLPKLPRLCLAVVGHIESVEFLAVDRWPQPGCISHARQRLEEPAGAGAVIAVQLAQLLDWPVHFFTALGRDSVGEACVQRLQEKGVNVHVAWRDGPTRRGISLVGGVGDQSGDRSGDQTGAGSGDRAITVIGDRLTPVLNDPLPWDVLQQCDGAFITAADAALVQAARSVPVLAATPRVGLAVLESAGVQIDALIGSGLDPAELVAPGDLVPSPRVQISTEGAAGGLISTGDRYSASALPGPFVETYGCGDSFAAGVFAGLAAQWPLKTAIQLGCQLGAACATRFGPYA